MSSNVDNTLAERGSRYGEFTELALYTQDLKRAMQRIPENWHKLSDDKKEALEMVARKIGRILNGDPEYIDSWHDIIGYVRLVEKNLEAAQAPKPDPIGRTIQSYDAPVDCQIPLPPSAMPDGMNASHYCADLGGSVRPGYAVDCVACRKIIAGTG